MCAPQLHHQVLSGLCSFWVVFALSSSLALSERSLLLHCTLCLAVYTRGKDADSKLGYFHDHPSFSLDY